jgi:hypothetical protein
MGTKAMTREKAQMAMLRRTTKRMVIVRR